MKDSTSWPLMANNFTREDTDKLIAFLDKDPKLTNGSQVRAFEKEWGDWLGTSHNVMVNSGSSANELTMIALRELYGQGEVIVPPLTWVSDIAAILHAGMTPVFADITLETLALNPEAIAKAITPKSKAIFLTHILGYNGLSQRILDLCKTKNIALIEDCCESHGATFKGKKVGTFGLVSNFSFYYAHHLTTIEGGMISTDNPEIYEICRMARSHGMVREIDNEILREKYATDHPDLNPDFIFALPAHNMRSTEINAVIGRSQLKRLDGNNLKRAANLKLFLENLDPKKFFTEFETEGNSNYAFTLLLRHPDEKLRDRVTQKMNEHQIEFRRGMSGGGNQLRQPYLKRLFGDLYTQFPVTNHIHFYGFYLGNYPSLEKKKIVELCQTLNGI